MSETQETEVRIDWRFQSLLDSATMQHMDLERLVRAGVPVRDSYGCRRVWVDTLPSEEEMQKAREAHVYTKERGFDSYCPCCKQSYQLASCFATLQERGVCSYCEPFLDGRIEGVIAQRNPTVEEALAAPPGDIRYWEAVVLQRTLKEIQGVGSSPEESSS